MICIRTRPQFQQPKDTDSFHTTERRSHLDNRIVMAVSRGSSAGKPSGKGKPSPKGKPSSTGFKISKSSGKSKGKRPPPTEVKSKSRSAPEQLKKTKKRQYTEKELDLPTLNMITPVGVQQPRGKKRGKTFVDDQVRFRIIIISSSAHFD